MKKIKKIILLVMALFAMITVIVPAYAYETGSNVLTNNSYTITYTSSPLGTSGQAIKISIAFNGDAIGYDTLVINGIYAVSSIQDTSTVYSGIGQGYSPQVTNTDWSIYYQGSTQPILRPANVVKTLNEPIKADTVIDLYYFYNPVGDNFNLAVSQIKTRVSIILIDGGAGYSQGYAKALEDSEIYYNNLIQQMQDMIDSETSSSYESTRNEFGYYYNGIWLTATEWASIEYNRGWDESAAAGYGINILGAITEAATFTDHVLSANLGGGFNLYQLFIIPIVFGLMFMLIKMARGG